MDFRHLLSPAIVLGSHPTQRTSALRGSLGPWLHSHEWGVQNEGTPKPKLDHLWKIYGKSMDHLWLVLTCQTNCFVDPQIAIWFITNSHQFAIHWVIMENHAKSQPEKQKEWWTSSGRLEKSSKQGTSTLTGNGQRDFYTYNLIDQVFTSYGRSIHITYWLVCRYPMISDHHHK